MQYFKSSIKNVRIKSLPGGESIVFYVGSTGNDIPQSFYIHFASEDKRLAFEKEVSAGQPALNFRQTSEQNAYQFNYQMDEYIDISTIGKDRRDFPGQYLTVHQIKDLYKQLI